MIKIRRSTRTAIIFEETGQIHNRETNTEITLTLPRWAYNLLSKAAKLAYLLKLEIATWKNPNISLFNKIVNGYHCQAV